MEVCRVSVSALGRYDSKLTRRLPEDYHLVILQMESVWKRLSRHVDRQCASLPDVASGPKVTAMDPSNGQGEAEAQTNTWD